MKVAAIIYDPTTQEILCGLESYYCFEDSDDPIEQARLLKLETCSEPQAMNYAIELSRRHNIEIRYAEFQYGRTHFCCLTTNSHLGIIKGNSYYQEDFTIAVCREVYEEVGLIVPINRWDTSIQLHHPFRPSRLFFLAVTPEERINIEIHIEERRKRHCGELFQIAFRNLQTTNLPMNHVTRRIVEWLGKNTLPPVSSELLLPFIYSSLLPIFHEDVTYSNERIEEPPFIWGKRRTSLIPLPY